MGGKLGLQGNVANSNHDEGIYLEDSNNNTLQGNTASKNLDDGIWLLRSNSNILENNTANSNNGGIELEYSNNNILQGNTASNNNAESSNGGIYLFYSSNNTLASNTMFGNRHNFGVFGDSLSDYIQNIDTSNVVGGKPIYYWVDEKDKVIPGDAGYAGVINSTNITVRDMTPMNNFRGVLFAYTNNSRITNVRASNNEHGIYLSYSSNNILTNNTCSNNYFYGIYLLYSSNNALQDNNVLHNNKKGIYLFDTDNDTLASNTASNNGFGIQLDFVRGGMLHNNIASNNHCGIHLYDADGNSITCNVVQNNTIGLNMCSESIDNNISYNNIIENGNYNTTTGGWEWQFYNNQLDAVEAKHNYGGAGMNNGTIDTSIYDNEEGGWGEVAFYPFEDEPVPCAPEPERPAFTTADAAIALRIAVGSRPPDPRWDASGDGSVTSLDALMILQAAAGTIEL